MTASSAIDRHFLNYAIKVGRRGLGTTAPNPSVGAVVVGRSSAGHPMIVGEATTATGGRPHAETQALAMAGAAARGATLYVSLEPCSHHGKTPPCTDAIVVAGVARVVCELADADPRVATQGFNALKEAGIEVELLAATPVAALAHLGHIKRLTEGRPGVTLKIAVSADGRVAAGEGAPTWVTGPAARARGHLLRARHDAILVGAGTVRADNPSLTCRLPGLESRSPLPIVLDSRFSAVPGSGLQKTQAERLLVFVGAPQSCGHETCVHVSTDAQGRPVLGDVLTHLHERGVTSLLVEGGPTVVGAFLDAGFADEVVVFQGAAPLTGDGLLPFGNKPLDAVVGADGWILATQLQVGTDTMRVYRARELEREVAGS